MKLNVTDIVDLRLQNSLHIWEKNIRQYSLLIKAQFIGVRYVSSW